MIAIHHETGVSVLHITGRLDIRAVKAFQRAVEGGYPSWVVELADVDYVDSAGLGLLLLLRERAQSQQGTVRLRGAQGKTRDVLMLARFDRLFELEP